MLECSLLLNYEKIKYVLMFVYVIKSLWFVNQIQLYDEYLIIFLIHACLPLDSICPLMDTCNLTVLFEVSFIKKLASITHLESDFGENILPEY